DAEQLDEMIGEFEPPTRNLSGSLPDASDDSLPSKVKEPFVFYGVPTRAGDRGRTGDVQLGKLSGPLRGKGFSAAVAETGRNTPMSASLLAISRSPPAAP